MVLPNTETVPPSGTETTQTTTTTKPSTWEEWYAAQDAETKALHDSHDAALKKALDAERETQKAQAKRLKELEVLEKQEQLRQDAEKTELQKLQDKATATEKELADTRMATTRLMVKNAAKMLATELKFADVADALALIDLSKFSYDADKDEVAGLKDALETLSKAKPYLLKAAGDGHGVPPKNSSTTQTNTTQKGVEPRVIL
jgi:hypothetical protein